MKFSEMESSLEKTEYVDHCYDIVYASIYEDNLGLFEFASLKDKKEIVDLIFEVSKLLVAEMMSNAYDFDHISYALLYYAEEHEDEEVMDLLLNYRNCLLKNYVSASQLDFILKQVEIYNDLETDFEIGGRYGE